MREIIDGVAVEINNSKGLNRKRRLQDSNDIREICVGFIDIGLGTDHTTETHHEEELTPTVRIAHFSVQEYLKSKRIRHQKAVMFSLASITAHAEIAQICLTYLLEHGLSSSNLDQNLLEEFPLAKFAAMYWYHHYQTTAKVEGLLEEREGSGRGLDVMVNNAGVLHRNQGGGAKSCESCISFWLSLFVSSAILPESINGSIQT